MRIDHELMKCSCAQAQCPVHNKCCFLPTEVHPSPTGTVSVLFVGQGGGRDERKLGRPFIGRAGKRIRQQVCHVRTLLKKHIGVAFSNTIRDNPEDNRIPKQDELDMCLPFLYEDIKDLMKKGLRVVIPLGNAASTALISGSSGIMGKDRGQMFNVKNPIFGEITMMPTYHPSYIMRSVPNFNVEQPSQLDITVVSDIMKAYEYGNDIEIETPNEEIQIENESLF